MKFDRYEYISNGNIKTIAHSIGTNIKKWFSDRNITDYSLVSNKQYRKTLSNIREAKTISISKIDIIPKINTVPTPLESTTEANTSLLSLTKTGKTRFYVIIVIFLLIVLYLEGSLFKKILTKRWYK